MPHLLVGEDNLPPQKKEWIQDSSWWLLVIYRHKTIVHVNAVSHHVSEGTVVIFPSGARGAHARVGAGTPHVYLLFQLAPDTRDIVSLPIRSDHDAKFVEFCSNSIKMISQSFAATQAFAWHVLWTLAEHPRLVEMDETLLDAESFIDKHLDLPISVSDVCEAVNVPYRTLSRLFEAEHGMGIKRVISQKRSREALRLISETNLSFKQIAAKVGVPDPHQFNKFVRRALGLSPSAVRQRAGEKGPQIW